MSEKTKRQPIQMLAPTAEERALMQEVTQTQGLNESTAVKEMFYDELRLAHCQRVWEEAHVAHMSNQVSVALDEEVDNVYLSNLAQKQFAEQSSSFRSLFIGWMKNQFKSQKTPYFSGKRVSDVKEQWVYSYGKNSVMAHIKHGKVSILAFDFSTNVDILQEVLDASDELN